MNKSIVLGFLVLLPSCGAAGQAVEGARDAHARLGEVCECVMRAEAQSAALPEGFPGEAQLAEAAEFCRQVSK